MPSQFFTKRDSGAASETRQMAEHEQRGGESHGSALGILLVLLGIAIIVALFYFTR